MPLLL
ncbi:unnamed protein product [Staurois parvus]|jgi:hypothetical protein